MWTQLLSIEPAEDSSTQFMTFFVQWNLVIKYNKLLGPEKFACYNETLLYQGYENDTIWGNLKLGTPKITLL